MITHSNLSDYWLIGNTLAPDGQPYSCDLCGHRIVDVYIVTNGKERALLGSECVKKLAIAQGKEKPKGIENIPKKKRRKVTLTLKQVRENIEDLLPW